MGLMPTLSKEIVKLRDNLRKYANTQVKVAEIGGGQDMPFEQAFSNLAHAYLKDKAPSLLDYEVGFQLVDRNQENTKAIGVFGFKVGPQWLYVPVFFLNGDLKGHELLYIKNQDLFVPLKENWINELLNRRPSLLGSQVNRNLNEIGVMPPHLYQLSRSPNKFASVVNKMPTWVKSILPAFAYAATTHPAEDAKYATIVDLPSFLKKEGAHVLQSLFLTFKENPKLASAFDELHGLNVIDDVIKVVNEKEKEAASTSILKKAVAKCKNTAGGVRCVDVKKPQAMRPKSVLPTANAGEINTEPGDLLKASAEGDPIDPSVGDATEHKPLMIYTYDSILAHGTALSDLDAGDRKKLVKDKVLIKDKRPETNIAYEVDSPVRLQNPVETGLYDVLVKPNKVEKCLVIRGPYSDRKRANFATVIRLENGDKKGKAWLNIHPAHIWMTKQYTNEEFQDWWNKLENCKTLPSGNGLHLLLGNTGEGTLPFTVKKEINGDSIKTYDVYFKDWARKERPDHLPYVAEREMEYRSYYDGTRITLTGKRGASLRSTGADLYVPDDYKIITLKAAKKDDDDCGCCFECDAESEPSPIQLGDQLDIDLLLGTKTASVKIYDTGTEVEINGKRMQKLAGLIHLVQDWGLREDQSRVLLKRAEKAKVTRFRIKSAAQQYDLQRSGISAPSFPEAPTGYDTMTGGKYPTQSPGEWNMKVPELSAANTDRMIYHPVGPEPNYQQPMPDRDAQQVAMQASQTGQKEIFDTAMIGSLLKAVRDDSMVDRYMGDLMKGLDRLGRILFLFYWHGERFQDRYGKQDMVELEDGIRNSFETLGDLVLFLKQRSPDSSQSEINDLDLNDVSSE